MPLPRPFVLPRARAHATSPIQQSTSITMKRFARNDEEINQELFDSVATANSEAEINQKCAKPKVTDEHYSMSRPNLLQVTACNTSLQETIHDESRVQVPNNDSHAPSLESVALNPAGDTEDGGNPTSPAGPMAAVTEAAFSHQPTPQSQASKGAFVSGLYGRERNPRRPATKRFREVPTPSGKSNKASAAAKEVLVVILPTPSIAVRRKRHPSTKPQGTPQKQKRRKQDSDVLKPEPVALNKAQLSADVERGLPDVGANTQTRPERDEKGDRAFADEVMKVLECQMKRKVHDMGKRQAERILQLLQVADYASEHEAKFLSTEQAAAAVSPNRFWNNIIVTEAQQQLPLQTVESFLGEYYQDCAEVWIQDPGKKRPPMARKVKMMAIKERFAAHNANMQPWNLLELATHWDDGLRPGFLNNEDCRLLTKLKIPDSADQARRRVYDVGYKEVEKWALLAQAGALTEPHQDSHGYSTFITVNVGHVGFGWLSAPTDTERAAWRRSPTTFIGGTWRYVVLKPGQTVYFPAGTVHFVFRLPSAGHTLAFGGHVLRCSNIVHWVKMLIEERNEKNITNEDLTDSASGHLERVERFVGQALVAGQADKWGGRDAIEDFLRLKEEFFRLRQR